jgi:hypothetical protein
MSNINGFGMRNTQRKKPQQGSVNLHDFPLCVFAEVINGEKKTYRQQV